MRLSTIAHDRNKHNGMTNSTPAYSWINIRSFSSSWGRSKIQHHEVWMVPHWQLVNSMTNKELVLKVSSTNYCSVKSQHYSSVHHRIVELLYTVQYSKRQIRGCLGCRCNCERWNCSITYCQSLHKTISQLWTHNFNSQIFYSV